MTDLPGTDIFKDYIDPALEQGSLWQLHTLASPPLTHPHGLVWDWLAGHPQFASLILLISSLVPFIPFQTFQAYLTQLPGEVNAHFSQAVGYLPDGDVRPGQCPPT